MDHPDLPPFEVICEQYKPLIMRTLNRYQVKKDREDYLQVGRIALWEAYAKYDARRGPFAALAVRYVRGRVLKALKQRAKGAAVPFSCCRSAKSDEEIEWPDPEAEQSFHSCEWQELIDLFRGALSDREQIILTEHLLNGVPLAELALRHRVSVETVKTWKKRALKKMRAVCPPLDA